MQKDIAELDDQFDAIGRDYAALVDGLDERSGTWRPEPSAWSVAECLDHLATANRAYLAEMRPAAAAARTAGRTRRGPAKPGFFGRLFAYTLDAPPDVVTPPTPLPPVADVVPPVLVFDAPSVEPSPSLHAKAKTRAKARLDVVHQARSFLFMGGRFRMRPRESVRERVMQALVRSSVRVRTSIGARRARIALWRFRAAAASERMLARLVRAVR